jgi:hypothetical protein
MTARGVDALIVNHFGPLEAAGRGFSEAIAVASETKTSLVIAVPKFEFERWTRFSNRQAGLEARQGLEFRSSNPAVDARACEVFK